MSDADAFMKSKRARNGWPYPTAAQEGLNILIKHFLGGDWYVIDPLSQEEVNTIAVHKILAKYGNTSIWEECRKRVRRMMGYDV